MWLVVRAAGIVTVIAVIVLTVGVGDRVLDALAALLGVVGVDAGWASPAPPPGPTVTFGGLAAGVVAAVVRPLERLIEQLVTLLHELGHTVVAAALGARPAGIVLRHDASGHATARWVGRATAWRRLALAAVAFAGLPAAALTTAAGAQLLQLLGPEAVLWGAAIAGGVVALLARSAWSLVIALVFAGSAVVALTDRAEPWAATLVVAVLSATTLVNARGCLRATTRPILPGDDARAVRAELGVPPRMVQVVQVLVTLAAAAWTVWLLLPDPSAVADLLDLGAIGPRR